MATVSEKILLLGPSLFSIQDHEVSELCPFSSFWSHKGPHGPQAWQMSPLELGSTTGCAQHRSFAPRFHRVKRRRFRFMLQLGALEQGTIRVWLRGDIS